MEARSGDLSQVVPSCPGNGETPSSWGQVGSSFSTHCKEEETSVSPVPLVKQLA